MSRDFTTALEEVVRGLQQERAELEDRIRGDRNRVEAIDTMICGFRAVYGPGGPCHVPTVFARLGDEAGAVCVPVGHAPALVGG
ncbi:MAG: hypothetical protein JWM27_3122 [Gemmatimonadetes bacterium]|nr:hypothetical protein [Gemmatimonadota bacterium]